MIICSVLFALAAAAQEQSSPDSVRLQENKHTLMGGIRQVQHYLDEKARAKVDSHYIEVPGKPWSVILRYNANGFRLDYDSHIDFPGTNESADWQLCFEPPMASSIGFSVGYRGTGFSFSKSLTENAGRYYAFSSAGAMYGLNFRLRRLKTSSVSLNATDFVDGEAVKEHHYTGFMQAPVWIRSVYINGYYVFNGRRYSQAAAYSQSVIQRRSAGSLLVGATWYQSSLDFSEPDNFAFMLLSDYTGCIKVQQANLGVGYGYNFVPFRGFIVNAMVMPTVSVYNRVKVSKYDCNYDLSPKEAVDDYGTYNPETRLWANGRADKPYDMKKGDDPIDCWEMGYETEHSMFRLNVDLRLGIAYNWRNYFIGIQGQFNNFTYKKDQNKVTLFDAYARASLGIRL
jgi:hypothetical protein